MRWPPCRYEAADDFGKPETAFNICTFWRIDALARIGRKAEARAIFETSWPPATRWACMPEDTHPDTREMGGNFPQTYSMVGVINAAVRLSAPWDSGFEALSDSGRGGSTTMIAPMSRLVVISNRLADPRKPAAGAAGSGPGEFSTRPEGYGLAGAAPWSKAAHPARANCTPARPAAVTLATVDLQPRRPRQLLPRLQQQRAVAGVPLPADGRLQRQLHRGLPAREPDVCAQAAAAAARRR